MTGFPPAVIRALKKRSRGICEGCGFAAATEAHHRQYRSRGGTDTLDNALHLCGWGNHTGCHGIAHTGEGETRGWSVRSGHDTSQIPALLVRGLSAEWHTLPVEGVPVLINAADAVELLVLIGARKVA